MNEPIKKFMSSLSDKFPRHPTLPNEPDKYITVPGRKYTKIAMSRDGVKPSSA
jgi:hypothetical protein